jgi:hypothetical protein
MSTRVIYIAFEAMGREGVVARFSPNIIYVQVLPQITQQPIATS